MAACTDVPVDDERSDKRVVPPKGVIRGTVTYIGPRPCSRDGHIVGNAVLLVFNRRNPPPPLGIATTAENFVAVPGDVLFGNEPRSVGHDLYCPPDDVVTNAAASFTIAPLEAGSYMIAAFYDRRGRFLPTFKYRDLPEAGDIAGGFVDLDDARTNAANPNYVPKYLPVDVGIPRQGVPGTIRDFTMDPRGFVADNIPVTLGSVVPYTRPYFHPEGSEIVGESKTSDANPKGDKFAVPVLAMPQDIHIFAVPTNVSPQTLNAYQSSFRSLKVLWGVAPGEVDSAVDENGPFGLQLPSLPPAGKGGLLVFSRGVPIPENPAVPDLWPQVAFVKLADDPFRASDPQSLVVQGTPEESNVTGKPPGPVVIIQGITLFRDSLAATVAGLAPKAPSTAALFDHVSVLVRPAALCFDPRRVDAGALLVTPHLVGSSADALETGDKLLFDAKALGAQHGVREFKRGCLPKGRYAMTLIYPTGQAWTVPNEIGSCASAEGDITIAGPVPFCSQKTRPVLLSQGSRAVLEIVGAAGDGQKTCTENPVPDACLHL